MRRDKKMLGARRVYLLGLMVVAVSCPIALGQGTIEVVPNPCIAGEPATICAVVSGGASEITSAKVNGVDANMTVLDSANVMIAIPIGVIQAGTNSLTLTKPGDTLTGIIDGIPPIGTPVGLADFFATAADQIKSTTIARMAGHREGALSNLVEIQTKAAVSRSARDGKRAVSASAREGLGLLRETEQSITRSLQVVLQQNPSPETARAARTARRSVQTKSSQVREEVHDQEHFDRDVVGDVRDQMFDALEIDDAEDADKAIEQQEKDNLDRDAKGNAAANAAAISACAAAARTLIASRAWHANQLALIVAHSACVLANLAAPCACLTTTPAGRFDLGIEGLNPKTEWGVWEVPLRVFSNFRVVVDIQCNPPLALGTPIKLTPDEHDESPFLRAVDPSGNPCDAVIGNPVSGGAEVNDALTASSALNPVNCPPCTLIYLKYAFMHGNVTCWQTMLIHLVEE